MLNKINNKYLYNLVILKYSNIDKNYVLIETK